MKGPSYIYFVPLVLLIVFSMAKSIGFQIHDFGNYYYGGQLLVDDQFSEMVYNADDFNVMVKERYTDQFYGAYYPNPPSLALIYAPLSYLSPRTAKLLINLISVIVFILAILKLKNYWKLPDEVIAIFTIVFAYPIYNCVLFGQPYLIIFGLIVYGYIHLVSMAHSRYLFSLPLAILLKVSPVVLLSVPLLERKIRHLVIYAIVLIVCGLLSLIWIDLGTWLYFVSDVLTKTSNGILYNGFAIGAESLPMLLRNIFVSEELLNPNPAVNSKTAYIIIYALIKAILYMIGIVTSASKSIKTGTKISTWLILLLLLSPNISSYGLLYLLFPYLYLIYRSKKFPVIPSVILLFTCLYQQVWFESLPLLFLFGKLFGVALFLIYFLYREGVQRVLWTKWSAILMTVLSVIFLLLAGKSHQSPIGGYVLPYHPKALLHDYEIDDNGKVTIITHTIGKYDTTYHQLPTTSYQSIEVMSKQELLNNVDGMNSTNQAIKNIIKADNDIYFMTDQGRAPGFYALKTIKQTKTSQE